MNVVVRMFSSALMSQAVLSGSSLLIGLLLIREVSDHEFGSYVLVTGGILLLTSLQGAFFGPQMVIRMTPLDRSGRGDVVGGLFREQRRVLTPAALGASGIVALLCLTGAIHGSVAFLLVAAVAAAVASLNREYFRLALLAHRRATEVLRGDIVFVMLLLAGALLAIHSPAPAAVATGGLAVACAVSGAYLSRVLRDREAWNPNGMPGILRQIARGAAWSTAGAGIHWTFSQGYSYLVAAVLDVRAVAAVAATRLLLMPVNLLSTGVRSLMLPVTSAWLHETDARIVFQRLIAVSGVLVGAAVCYIGMMWLLRDWIFDVVLDKSFAQRDQLLLLWSAVALLMVVRDQLMYVLLAREQFRRLTGLAAASALFSLLVTWWGMLHHGVVGALYGVLSGELVSAAGVILLSLHEIGVDRVGALADRPGTATGPG